MKHKILPLAGLLTIVATLFLWMACNKPSPFGASLLEDQEAEYNFTDTLSVRCTIEREDSIITSSTAAYYLCGALNDPIFGKSEAAIYTLLREDNLDPGFDPATMQVDSIVLFMRYNAAGVYGDTSQPQTLRILRLTESIDYNKKIYYSDDELAGGAEIGRVDNFLPHPRTADSIFAGKVAHLRVKLDNSFANELFNLDSSISSSDTLFFQALRGLKIVSSTLGAAPGAILAFNLEDQTYSRVRLYYTQDTTHRVFDYFFAGVKKFGQYTHDYSGTPAGQKIGQRSDDFLYIQGMQGLRVKIEFPTANSLHNILINRAELELTAANLPGDSPWLYPANNTILSQLRGDSILTFTSDVLYSLGATLNEGFAKFGGYPETIFLNGQNIKRYRLSLSDVFQQIADDNTTADLKKRTVYLSVYPQNRSAERVVFYGPGIGNGDFRAKLNLKYTRLP